MADAKTETLILTGASVILALIAVAIAPLTIFHWGISIDTLFLATVCLLLAGVFLLNPIISFLDGSLKEIMKGDNKAKTEK